MFYNSTVQLLKKQRCSIQLSGVTSHLLNIEFLMILLHGLPADIQQREELCGSCSEEYLRWHPIASPLNLLPEQTCLTIIILSWNLLFLFHFEGSLGGRGGKICLVVDVKARRDERLHGCSVQYLGRTAQQPALALHPPPPRSCPSATLNRPPRCKGDHHHNRIHLHEVQLPASYSHLSFLSTPHCLQVSCYHHHKLI